ncbi:hypothetical protein G6F31_019539 [Rhizopus arrhizus]|nr:hypothetical protein G6F31_019539 [Rhizopus arrhizus]
MALQVRHRHVHPGLRAVAPDSDRRLDGHSGFAHRVPDWRDLHRQQSAADLVHRRHRQRGIPAAQGDRLRPRQAPGAGAESWSCPPRHWPGDVRRAAADVDA